MGDDTLLRLADRCEREEPSRELDEAIARELGWNWVGLSPRYWIEPSMDVAVFQAGLLRGDGITLDPRVHLAVPPRFGSSLDAAVTLVPENATWELAERGGAQVTVLTGRFLVSDDIERYGRGKTPALALCAAALRARAASHG